MTHPVPTPAPLKRPLPDEIEWLIRDLVKSIREDGSVIEDEDGNLAVHPAIAHVSYLARCMPLGRVSKQRGDW